MSGRVKDIGAGDLCMTVRRGLQPLDGLEVLAKRRFETIDGFLEALILSSGHLLRFHRQEVCVSESLLPMSRRRVSTDSTTLGTLWGEMEGEMEHDIEGTLRYWCTLEPDEMEPDSFAAQWREIEELGRRPEVIAHSWGEGERRILSVIEVGCSWRECHVGCYHLHAPSGLVVRSQSLFEVTGPGAEGSRAGCSAKPT